MLQVRFLQKIELMSKVTHLIGRKILGILKDEIFSDCKN